MSNDRQRQRPSNFYISENEELKKLISFMMKELADISNIDYINGKLDRIMDGIPFILHPTLERYHHRFWSQVERNKAAT